MGKKTLSSKGFISLSIIALGVLIISAIALPLATQLVGKRVTTQQRAAGCSCKISCGANETSGGYCWTGYQEGVTCCPWIIPECENSEQCSKGRCETCVNGKCEGSCPEPTSPPRPAEPSPAGEKETCNAPNICSDLCPAERATSGKCSNPVTPICCKPAPTPTVIPVCGSPNVCSDLCPAERATSGKCSNPATPICCKPSCPGECVFFLLGCPNGIAAGDCSGSGLFDWKCCAPTLTPTPTATPAPGLLCPEVCTSNTQCANWCNSSAYQCIGSRCRIPVTPTPTRVPINTPTKVPTAGPTTIIPPGDGGGPTATPGIAGPTIIPVNECQSVCVSKVGVCTCLNLTGDNKCFESQGKKYSSAGGVAKGLCQKSDNTIGNCYCLNSATECSSGNSSSCCGVAVPTGSCYQPGAPTACPVPVLTLGGPTVAVVGEKATLTVTSSSSCGASALQYKFKADFNRDVVGKVSWEGGWLSTPSWALGPFNYTGKVSWTAKARYYNNASKTYKESDWSAEKTFIVVANPCETCPAGNREKGKGNTDCNGAIDVNDFSLWKTDFLAGIYNKRANFDCQKEAGIEGNKVDLKDFEIWRRAGSL